jgi:hypothetical protein
VAIQTASKRKAPSARAIAEGALLGDLTVLIVLIGLYVPYAGPAMVAISPIPLLLLILRQGWRVMVEAFVAACLIVSFLTGPFSCVSVITIAARAAALGIGLRFGWPVRKTILAGTAFLWLIAWVGITLAALALPGWRAATEQGMALTFHQLVGFVGVFARLAGLGGSWKQLEPALNDFLAWFLAHWLLLLPLVIIPVLLVAVCAEYVIVEVILPRFGFTPPPFRFPWAQGGSGGGPSGGRGLRMRLQHTLELKLAARDAQRRRGAAVRNPRAPGAGLVPEPVRVPVDHNVSGRYRGRGEDPVQD